VVKLSLVKVREGATSLWVPRASLGVSEPPTVPVFFNPAASLNRDLSVAVTAARGAKSFCDSMSGTGARGVRVAAEARCPEVTMVDFNAEALRVARRNARTNSVSARCSFVAREANSYLFGGRGRQQRFDSVDVDPFGTPAPFLRGALAAVEDEGVVSVTATDTAVLCGVHVRVCSRRYGARPLNNEFGHETALRILVNALRREAGVVDLGVVPLVAHSTRHYLRAFVRVERGATRADQSLAHEGFLVVCSQCADRSVSHEFETRCPRCGGRARCAGPLWAGELSDPSCAEAAEAECAARGFGDALRVLERLGEARGLPPFGYSVSEVCSRLRVASVSEGDVRASLESKGFKTAAQPFEREGFKSDAPYSEVVKAAKDSSEERGPLG
jgi:tRNA (guanine26-N2/guanine27-N2)-dimethyltransferase